MNKKRPVHEVRLGMVRAAVWENDSRYNVTFSQIYKDGDEWKRSESFGRDHLLLVAKAADLAHTWICERRAGGVSGRPDEQ